MMLRDSLLPPGLAASRPGFATLVADAMRHLSDAALEQIGQQLGQQPPITALWRAIGGEELYGYAIEPFDIDPRGLCESLPVLGEDCMSFVRFGRKGRRALHLALLNLAAGREFVPNRANRAAASHPGLAYAPPGDGVFRAARYVAVVRGRQVKPEDLVAAAALLLTPSIRDAIAHLGLDLGTLERAYDELRSDLGRVAVAKLRHVLIFPTALLHLPTDWRLEDVTTTCGHEIVRSEDDLLPDLDALWLVSRYLWHAKAAGLPPTPRAGPNRPLPSAHKILRRHAASGWEAVFSAAFQAAGWERCIFDRTGLRGSGLVARGIPITRTDNQVRVPAAPVDPVERARREYAEVQEALASRIVGRDVIDRLALVVLAQRRGVSQRLLFTGSSGAGKTYMARAIAEVVGVPCYFQDATGLTETGYRGLNVPDLVSAMHRNAGGDLKALEASVLFLDEIDKTRIGEGTDGVSFDKRWGMQAGLLSLLDGKTPIVADDGALTVRTSGILMICAGAFSDAPWAAERSPTTNDLVRYGLLRELAERLRDRIFLPPRTTGQLAELLRQSDESVQAVVGPLASELGIELRVLPAAYKVVARMIAEEVGGLGLRSGNQLLVAAGQRALLRALQESSDPVALVTPDDIDLLIEARR